MQHFSFFINIKVTGKIIIQKCWLSFQSFLWWLSDQLSGPYLNLWQLLTLANFHTVNWYFMPNLSSSTTIKKKKNVTKNLKGVDPIIHNNLKENAILLTFSWKNKWSAKTDGKALFPGVGFEAFMGDMGCICKQIRGKSVQDTQMSNIKWQGCRPCSEPVERKWSFWFFLRA